MDAGGTVYLSWGDTSPESEALAYLICLHVTRVPEEAMHCVEYVLTGTVAKLPAKGWILDSEHIHRIVRNAAEQYCRDRMIDMNADVFDGTIPKVVPCTHTL